jgi:hypothetical protein
MTSNFLDLFMPFVLPVLVVAALILAALRL